MSSYFKSEKKPEQKLPEYTHENTPLDKDKIGRWYNILYRHYSQYSGNAYAAFAQKEANDVWAYIMTTGYHQSSHLMNDLPRPLWYDVPVMAASPPSMCGGKVNISAFLSPMNGEVIHYYTNVSEHWTSVANTASELKALVDAVDKILKLANELGSEKPENLPREFQRHLTSVITHAARLIRAERHQDSVFMRVEAQRTRLMEIVAGVSRATFPKIPPSLIDAPVITVPTPEDINANAHAAANKKAKAEAEAREHFYAREADDMTSQSRNLFRVMGAGMLMCGQLMPQKRNLLKEQWKKLLPDVISAIQWMFFTQKFVYEFPTPYYSTDVDLAKDDIALYLVRGGELPGILHGMENVLSGPPPQLSPVISKAEPAKVAAKEGCNHCQVDEKRSRSEKSPLLEDTEVGDCPCSCHASLPSYTK